MIEFKGLPEILAGREEELRNWLNGVAKSHGFSIRQVVYNFVSNAEILEINKKHLQHDYFTDIISFNYVKGKKISGEIFISVDQIEIQRHDFNNSMEDETLRIMVHGLLHFIGFDDQTDDQKAVMRGEEEKSLILHAQFSEN